MPVGSYGNTGSKVEVSDSNTSVEIFNVVVGVAATEFSQALPADTKGFLLRTRGNSELQLSYTATESGTKYITVNKKASYSDNNFYTSQTIYFQLDVADTVEIIAYTVA